MPSMIHEALLLLFRSRPSLAAEVLRDPLGVAVPTFAEARIESADLTEVVPRERRADHVVALYDGATPVMSIIVEAQRARDEEKRFAWPSYSVGAFTRHRCRVCLLVVTTDRAVAAWSARPIEIGPGHVLTPFVLGPSAVPIITAAEQARRLPELAVLSAMAHGPSEMGLEIALAALAGAAGLDRERAALYGDVVLSCLNEAARRTLEEMMASGDYEIQTEFVRKNIEKGRTEGRAEERAAAVLTVLEARGRAVPDDVRHRVLGSRDLGELERWLRRAAVVDDARAIFDAS